jgi:hypothetical protein
MGQREQAFRTCTAILHLADTPNAVVMEQAVQMHSSSVQAFELILKRAAALEPLTIRHENIRGAAYYRGKNHD